MTVTAQPQLGELEATLNDPEAFMKIAKAGQVPQFIQDLMNKKDEAYNELRQMVKDQSEQTFATWLKDSGAKIQRLPQAGNGESPQRVTRAMIAKGKGAVYNSKAPGAAIDKSDAKPEDMADFLQGIWHHARTLPNSEELENKARTWKKIQNSFGSTVPADGGFLIPEELRSDLLQLAIEDSIVRSRAQVIPMSSLALPIPTVDETSRATSLFGGIVAYWTEEGAAATESQARFGAVRLEAKKLVIYCEAPNELIADADAFAAFISNNLPRALAFEEDDAFLTGSGVGEPLGVLNAGSSGTIAVTRTASGNAIEFADIVNVFSRLLPASYSKAVWLCAPDVLPNLLSITAPGGGQPGWLTGMQAIEGVPMTILGRPLIVTEKVPALSSRGDLSLIDFSHYLLGDRQTIQADSSPHFKFSSDKTAYKILERVDGRPWVYTALTPRNGSSNTLSPYVTVAA